MKIAFTVCSNNYLAQAKSLGDSIKKTNPEYNFFIGLADKLSKEIDYKNEIGHPIILAEDIGILDFESLWKKYSIIEFNTNVKPFFFHFFSNHFSGIEYLFYLDPDTYIFNDLNIIESEFGESGTSLLTPHILTPIDLDGEDPKEHLFLNFGIYNLGFFGVKAPQKENKLINWWKERTFHFGYDRISEGLFVDQLWHNFSPIFFDNCVVSKHPGLNMGPWNLHERRIADTNQVCFEGHQFPLAFYHFSNFNFANPTVISKYYSRYSFETHEELVDLYCNYRELLLLNGIKKFMSIKCAYMEMRAKFLTEEEAKKNKTSKKQLVKYYTKKLIPSKILQILDVIKS